MHMVDLNSNNAQVVVPTIPFYFHHQAIKDMHAAKMYKKMLIYWESCESGSMFKNHLPTDINVLAVTAANPSEPSYSCYFEGDGTMLGDEFSVRWMEGMY